jgi:hypothetical protein
MESGPFEHKSTVEKLSPSDLVLLTDEAMKAKWELIWGEIRSDRQPPTNPLAENRCHYPRGANCGTLGLDGHYCVRSPLFARRRGASHNMIAILFSVVTAWALLPLGLTTVKVIIGGEDVMDHFCQVYPLFVMGFDDTGMD